MTDLDRAKAQIDQLTATADRVLRNAVLRAVLPPGQYPVDCSPERAATLLESLEPALLSDVEQLRDLLKRAYFEGVLSIHRDLSGAPGVDPEMLDESVEFFTNRPDGDGEPFAP